MTCLGHVMHWSSKADAEGDVEPRDHENDELDDGKNGGHALT